MLVWLVISNSIIFWIACGVLAYGITYGYFQREFPTIAYESQKDDSAMALVFGALGPFGVLLSFVLSGFAKHGLKW